MNFSITFTQKETENKLIEEIEKAKKFIVIYTMFFNEKNGGGLETSFINLFNQKLEKNPDIYIEINIGVNPFMKYYIEELDKRIHVNIIKKKTIFYYVHHTRMFHTENVLALGGIDFTNIITGYPDFVQFGLFITTKSYFILNDINFRNIKLENLYNYTNYNNIPNITYKDHIIYCINNAKSHIFIDHQYCLYYPIIKALINKKKNSNIDIYILTNLPTSKNSINNNKLTVTLFCILFKNMLIKNGIVVLKNNKFTHNKIFIFDKKYILIGSMNLIGRSIECRKNGEKEIGIFLENEILAQMLLKKYDNW